MNLTEIRAYCARLGVELDASATCLYPSAGEDGRVLTFTHPEFLAGRGADRVPAIGLYVLLDRNTPHEVGALTRRMGDERTTVEVLHHRTVRVHQIDGELLVVRWRSETERFRERLLGVLMLRTDNEHAAPVFARARWVPDVFVGVCDGCSFGGNDHCVNRLTTWGLPPAAAREVQVPRWWITDHFRDATVPNPLAVGDRVRSTDPGFPFSFRKVALLSSEWGHYGRDQMPGATLFELMR